VKFKIPTGLDKDSVIGKPILGENLDILGTIIGYDPINGDVSVETIKAACKKTLFKENKTIGVSSRAVDENNPEKIKRIIEEIDSLSKEYKMEILGKYCHYCGGDAPCQCWNDD